MALSLRTRWRKSEWIEYLHVEVREIHDIAGYDDQAMPDGRGRDHRILVQRIGSAVHQSGPDTKTPGIHRQEVI